MSDFSVAVRDIVANIPAGSTMTYQEVAKAAGNPKAARAVANLMAKNFDKSIPCHRVIRSDGKLGGYNRGGVAVKRKILENEGVKFK
jgi:methylated-DNA-[protein]-cysteine S-methyltransferase